MRWRDDHSDSSTGLCLYTRARGSGHACGGSIEELNDLSLSHIYRASAPTSAPRILQDPSARSGRPPRVDGQSAHADRLPTSPATLAHVAASRVGGTRRGPAGRTRLTPTWAATAGRGGLGRRGVRYFPARIGPRSRTEEPQYPIEFVALDRSAASVRALRLEIAFERCDLAPQPGYLFCEFLERRDHQRSDCTTRVEVVRDDVEEANATRVVPVAKFPPVPHRLLGDAVGIEPIAPSIHFPLHGLPDRTCRQHRSVVQRGSQVVDRSTSLPSHLQPPFAGAVPACRSTRPVSAARHGGEIRLPAERTL